MTRAAGLPYDVFIDETLGEVIGFRWFMPAERFILPCALPNCLESPMYIKPDYLKLGLYELYNELIYSRYRHLF
jgi:hypothetical protein